ncbi:DUF6483 family protein [Frisingicoccus caecimuris]|uniref:Uncharacterized protein n=1 Tax=Frisingicoccus caecimuris TaxID=1796636 RepID=A0A4R2LE47_9FIRM|nr:DUF6483 family protein [Frisingicoccus caecimuris]MCR1919496.1 DUF6483 family protein [Frisingicoccus caecimuris]TCO83941.1 hypothetical protein EV212_11193 [Frisingicoccus caecimuris]
MVERDYIMRLIREMVRAILKLFFNIDSESPTEELLAGEEEKQLLDILLAMVDVGDINHAENQLYEIVSGGDMEKLKMALLFYSYLNDKSDDFLTEHDFSRGEIKSGIKDMVSMYGLDSMADVFLSDM